MDENEETSSRKVIFCVHGKLSGCCTVVKGGATSVDEISETAATAVNVTATGINGSDFQQTASSKILPNLDPIDFQVRRMVIEAIFLFIILNGFIDYLQLLSVINF